MMVHVPSFSLAYANSLQVMDGHSSALTWSPSAAGDVSSAYAAIKLWLLLAGETASRRVNDSAGVSMPAENTQHGDNEERRIWNEVWPPFEHMIQASMIAAENVSPIVTTVWASYVDLVIFLLQSGSIIALDSSVVHMALLEKLCSICRHETSIQKFIRALHALQHPPPRVSFAILLEKSKGDFLAAEKLASAFQNQSNRRVGHGHGSEGSSAYDRRARNAS